MSRATMRVRPGIPLGLVTLLGVAFAATQLAFAAPAGQPAGAAGYAAEQAGGPGFAPVPARPRPASAAAPRGRAAAASAGVRRRRVGRAHRYGVLRLRRDVPLSDRPGRAATQTLSPTTEFGSPRIVSVAARRRGWLGVVTSEVPNGRLAWIRRNAGSLRAVRWSLHGDISTRTLTLRRDGRQVLRLSVAVGAPGSPTPTGRFAVTDKLSGGRFGPYYGCCILALNGRQPNPPPGWTGGNRVAIHGTDAPGTIGAAASAGCLRAGDGELQVLMRKVPLGTPVFLRR
jgi:hypothetical protein